ncbi:MAG: ABC transporter permease [Azospirillaceae bacterium]
MSDAHSSDPRPATGEPVATSETDIVVAGWRRALGNLVRVFNTNKTSWLGLGIFVVIALAAILAPVLAPHDPAEQSVLHRVEPPSAEYPLGTDAFGRDVLSRLLYGAQISLLVGVSSVLLAMIFGGTLGIIAGYKGGRTDTLIMRAMDVLLSFPTLIMGLLIVAMLGPNLINMIIAIALTLVPKFARIARAPTVSVKERAYIEAGRALGYSDTRIMVVHILPNVIGEVLVLASLWTANAIQIEAGFSFIGLTVRPPTPTWGGMIREGFEQIFNNPWLAVYPGICILLTVFALNLLGDGIRDAVDPKLRDV